MLEPGWVTIEGGPLILISENAYQIWRVSKAGEADSVRTSEFGEAIDLLDVGDEQALILPGNVLASTWVEHGPESYCAGIVEWPYVDEATILEALRPIKKKAWKNLKVTFTTKGGKHFLIDSSECGDYHYFGSVEVTLDAGTYALSTVQGEEYYPFEFIRLMRTDLDEKSKAELADKKKAQLKVKTESEIATAESILTSRDGQKVLANIEALRKVKKFSSKMLSGAFDIFKSSEDPKIKSAILHLIGAEKLPAEILKAFQEYVLSSPEHSDFYLYLQGGTFFDFNTVIEIKCLNHQRGLSAIGDVMDLQSQIQRSSLSVASYEALLKIESGRKKFLLACVLAEQIMAHRNFADLRLFYHWITGANPAFYEALGSAEIDEIFENLLATEEVISSGKKNLLPLVSLTEKSLETFFSSASEGLHRLSIFVSNHNVLATSHAKKWLLLILKDQDKSFMDKYKDTDSYISFQKALKELLDSETLDKQKTAGVVFELRNTISALTS